MTDRLCTECGELKPMTEFDRHRAGKPYRRGICRPCDLERKRIWHHDNRERINATRRQRRREAANVRT